MISYIDITYICTFINHGYTLFTIYIYKVGPGVYDVAVEFYSVPGFEQVTVTQTSTTGSIIAIHIDTIIVIIILIIEICLVLLLVCVYCYYY